MDPYRVYVTRRIPKPGLDLLAECCEVEVNAEDRPLPRTRLLEKARDVDGVIGLLTDRIDAEFFGAAERLKGYANYAVGLDNVDLAEATRRGVPVSNTPDVLTNATAEMAWALLLAVCRRVTESDRVMRAGRWTGWGPLQFLGTGVTGRTLGIVGAGRIGTAMALMSRGFSMPVLYHSPSANPVLEKELSARRVDFDTLLAESDYISLHAPLTPQTRHLFGTEAFAKMKPTAYLINTSRGPLIHESRLVEALKEGRIAGAGLDVYEREPEMAQGLSELDNVVFTPHTGSATVAARTDMALLAARNLLAMLRGERAKNCVNPEVYESKSPSGS